MNAGRFVGRVGGLAVALGVGVALTSGPGVAWADDGSRPDSQSSSASPPSGTRSEDTSTASADSGSDNPKAASGPNAATGTVAGDDESHAAVGQRSHRTATDAEPTPGTSQPKHGRQAADGSSDEPSADGQSDRTPRTPIEPAAPSTDTEVPRPEVAKLSRQVPDVEAVAPPEAAAPAPRITVEVDRTSKAGPGSLTPDGPAAPVDSPLEVVALAVATRLRTSEQQTSAVTGNPTVPTQPVGEIPSTTTTFGAAVPNSASTVRGAQVAVPSPAALAVPAAVSAAPSAAPVYAATTSLATGPGPSAVTVGADGRMFVANTASWSVSVINTATGSQIDANPGNPASNEFQVGAWPGALALSPDGKKLFVANTGWMTVSVIDTTTYKAIDADPGNWFSNDFLVGLNPAAMTMGADGRLYVANRGAASVSVIDTRTYTRIDTDPIAWFPNDIAVGASPSALALNGTTLYVANRDSNTVSVIDTTTYRVTKTLTVGKQPSAMALGPTGQLYVVNTGANTVSVINTVANTVGAKPISVGPAPSSIAYDSAANRAFVANGNDTVSVIDTTTNTVTGTPAIDIDLTGGHAVAVGPNGNVYVADTEDRAVRVLAPTTGRAPIELGIGSGAHVGVVAGAFGSPQAVSEYLRGALCAAPNVCVPINYSPNTAEFLGPTSAAQGMDNGVQKLDEWIRSTPGKKIVLGHSFGSAIIYRWLREHWNDPTAPPPSELSFITLASTERSVTGYAYTDPNGMYNYRKAQGFGIPADTPYQVVDGCRKWDGWCYWIPGDSRSARGQNELHLAYGNVDLNDPANQVTVRGNVIEVLIPTPGWD